MSLALLDPIWLTWLVGAACLVFVVRVGLACAWAIADWKHMRVLRAMEREEFKTRIERERYAVELERNRKRPWHGWRKFQVERIEDANESGSARSFYLRPHDRKPIPGFAPGQFLTFRARVPGSATQPVRCYSLSDRPRDEYFRITVKRVPNGLVSGWMHEQVKQGDILDVRTPSGKFVLDLEDHAPIVLIAGGVGITPFLCMLEALDQRRGARETWCLYAAPNGEEFVHRDRFEALAKARDDLRVLFVHGKPTKSDREGMDSTPVARAGAVAQWEGRVGRPLLEELLPETAPQTHHFFICGPPPMMDAVANGLTEWGVAKERIHLEAFGPKSAAAARRLPDAGDAPDQSPAEARLVTFGRSSKEATWEPDGGSLLDLAGAQGISIDAGCCAGDCGTCMTAIKGGSVRYLQDPTFEVTEGCCLPCVALPASDLVLDA